MYNSAAKSSHWPPTSAFEVPCLHTTLGSHLPVLATAIYQLFALTKSTTYVQISSKHCQATSFSGLDVANSNGSQPAAVEKCVAIITSFH